MRGRYSNVNAMRRTLNTGSVRSMSQLEGLPTPESMLADDKRHGALIRQSVHKQDLDRNLGEMVTYWSPILRRARRLHRKLPRIPKAAKEALKAAGITPPVRV